MSAPFHFVVFLPSFVIRSVFTIIRGKKKFLTLGEFINYQQHVIAVYINYGSRPSKTLGSQIVRGMVKFGKRAKK